MPNNNDSGQWWEALPVVGSLISGIGSIGQGKKNRRAAKEMNQANIDATLRLNAENRAFSKEMWDLTNQYNSPAQMMERLKAAGLNPHLAYGNQPQASQPMSASTSAPHSERLPADTTINEIGQSLFQASQNYIAMRKQQTEIDNMEKTQNVMDSQILANTANTAKTMQDTAKSKYDLELAQQLRDNVIQESVLNVRNMDLAGKKTEQDINNIVQSMKESNQRIDLSQAQIRKISQDIEYSKKQIKLMQIQGKNGEADLVRKNLENDLRKMGINPTDPTWQRVLGRGAVEAGKSLNLGDGLRKTWNDLKNINFYDWFTK